MASCQNNLSRSVSVPYHTPLSTCPHFPVSPPGFRPSVYCLAFMSPPGFFIIPEDPKAGRSYFRGERSSKPLRISAGVFSTAELKGMELSHKDQEALRRELKKYLQLRSPDVRGDWRFAIRWRAERLVLRALTTSQESVLSYVAAHAIRHPARSGVDR